MTTRARKHLEKDETSKEENDDDANSSSTPPDIRKAAVEARVKSALPKKSAHLYERAYDVFHEWFTSQPGVGPRTKVSESILMTYFDTQVSPASVWSIYSRLKPTIRLHHKVAIEIMSDLQDLLKRKSAEHKPVQAPTFTAEHIATFLKDFPDDGCGFVKKIAILFGLAGGLRVDELTNMKRSDVIVCDDGYLRVNIEDSKTGARHFFVHPHPEDHLNAVKMYKQYLMLVPEGAEDRIWLRMQDGKVQNRPLGKNTMAGVTKEMAEFLQLPHPEMYTSHSLRRTGATLLAEQGISTEALRQYGGWKNATTAQVYIDTTVTNKKRLAASVLEPSNPAKKPSPAPTATATAPPAANYATPNMPSFPATLIAGGNFNECSFVVHMQ